MLRKSFYTTHTFKVFILYFFYRLLLDFIYIKWVVPIYGYSGFELKINSTKMILSYLITILLIILIPKNNKKVSYMVLQLHLIVMIFPMLSLFGMANLSTKFMVMVTFCFILQIWLIKRVPFFKIIYIRNAKVILIGILSMLTIVTYIYLLKTQDINFNTFNLKNIYIFRSNQKISSALMSYLITWQYRIINPTILVLSYFKKDFKSALLAIGMQILLFMMFPHKEVFLAIGLIMFILFIYRYKYEFDSFFIKILSIVSVLFIFLYEIFNKLMPFAIIPVRLLYIPAQIKFQHFEFFTINKKLYYSEGMIGKMIGLKYPYSMPSGFLVSGGISNSNTGYLAYAFDNMGLIGMILISLLFVFIMILIDSLVKKENKKAIFSILVYPMIILNDGDLLTLLLTGGLLLLIIILLVYSNIGGSNE